MSQTCHYCAEETLTDNWNLREGANKALQFPDGRKIKWKYVCSECLAMRAAWQQKRDIEAFQEKERRKAWHKEILEEKERRLKHRLALEALRSEKIMRAEKDKQIKYKAYLEAQLEAVNRKINENDA